MKRQSSHALPEKIRAASSRLPLRDPDRRAAEYVLSIGGRVCVNDGLSAIAAVAELPRGRFRLTCVDLHVHQQVTNEGLAVVKEREPFQSFGSTIPPRSII